MRSIVDVFKDYLIGQNPLRIEHHWQYLYRMAPFRGTAIMGAVSAVDIALWDIKGKHFEVPVWELLGGNVRDKGQARMIQTAVELTAAAREAGGPDSKPPKPPWT